MCPAGLTLTQTMLFRWDVALRGPCASDVGLTDGKNHGPDFSFIYGRKKRFPMCSCEFLSNQNGNFTAGTGSSS